MWLEANRLYSIVLIVLLVLFGMTSCITTPNESLSEVKASFKPVTLEKDGHKMEVIGVSYGTIGQYPKTKGIFYTVRLSHTASNGKVMTPINAFKIITEGGEVRRAISLIGGKLPELIELYPGTQVMGDLGFPLNRGETPAKLVYELYMTPGMRTGGQGPYTINLQ